MRSRMGIGMARMGRWKEGRMPKRYNIQVMHYDWDDISVYT
jgi:hypothetical protein